ncbi:methyl-accepting chemotaxis protein [Salinispirillum sp. LH 10-3-1]|uniref:Methyl-accepting chemotaxis protein n=1 Tax=Salinispirillum sp. LH 10-3-1 TaxID=2952525 RepID=A0AB38YG54_9GAMM
MPSMNLKTKLLAAVLIMAFIAIAVRAITSFLDLRNQARQGVLNEITLAGNVLSGNVASWVADNIRLMETAAARLEAGDTLDHVLRLTQGGGDFLYAYLGTTQGDMIMYPPETLPSDYDPRVRPWYQQSSRANDSILTPPYTDASSGGYVVTFATPVRGQGVLGADLSLGVVVDTVLAASLGDRGYTFMVAGDGQILAHPDERFATENISTLNSSLTPQRINALRNSNELVNVRMDGKDSLVAFTAVPGSDWSLGFALDQAAVNAPIRAMLIGTLINTIIILAIYFAVALTLLRWLLAPLDTIRDAMHDIGQGQGDLTRRLTYLKDDELGQLSRSFNHFMETIQALVSQARDTSGALGEEAKATMEDSQENNQQIRLQQDEIGQVAAAIHEMSMTANEVAQSASETAEAARRSAEATRDGLGLAKTNRENMQKLTDGIHETTVVIQSLNEQALKINSILATIQGIAEQTNLLALNAAIEAARAGDQGRGFAVVADEVRALSQRTHDATGEIQGMIEGLQAQTGQAVNMMEKSVTVTQDTAENASGVASSLSSINDAIELINEMSERIAGASGEQHKATDEISRITSQIKEAADQLAQNSDEAEQRARALDQLAHDLGSNLNRFVV